MADETAETATKKNRAKGNGEKRRRLNPTQRVARQFARVQRLTERLAAAKEKLIAMIG